ncbi:MULTISPECIES: hypothetical protein [unclassified Variovorax]|jgi:hypothetical protein|uniref:hypothetical protein n=1 Tax=unclassified Variovorax TaxID=663243 RepID=UPI0009EBF534|nr:hypothetical protein [Variovorax sp. PAMC 28711]
MNDTTAEIWIAACAHRLQQHWRTVDPDVLEELATDLSNDSHLLALSPAQAAAEWLQPVACGPCAPATSPLRHEK